MKYLLHSTAEYEEDSSERVPGFFFLGCFGSWQQKIHPYWKVIKSGTVCQQKFPPFHQPHPQKKTLVPTKWFWRCFPWKKHETSPAPPTVNNLSVWFFFWKTFEVIKLKCQNFHAQLENVLEKTPQKKIHKQDASSNSCRYSKKYSDSFIENLFVFAETKLWTILGTAVHHSTHSWNLKNCRFFIAQEGPKKNTPRVQWKM